MAGHVVQIAEVDDASDYATARALFLEYAASLGVDLCFQGFAQELEQLPEMYGLPTGRLILGRTGDAVIGCVGIRRLAHETCEMKRLFVREGARGTGAGRQLAVAAMRIARRLGYRRMALDTLETMVAARRIYAALGFVDTDPYYRNPLPGVRSMAADLDGAV